MREDRKSFAFNISIVANQHMSTSAALILHRVESLLLRYCSKFRNCLGLRSSANSQHPYYLFSFREFNICSNTGECSQWSGKIGLDLSASLEKSSANVTLIDLSSKLIVIKRVHCPFAYPLAFIFAITSYAGLPLTVSPRKDKIFVPVTDCTTRPNIVQDCESWQCRRCFVPTWIAKGQRSVPPSLEPTVESAGR
jgi:hypothetical protein